MNQKYIVLAAIGFVAWFSWFYRYDASGGNGLVLDRWTGTMVSIRGDGFDLSKYEVVE